MESNVSGKKDRHQMVNTICAVLSVVLALSAFFNIKSIDDLKKLRNETQDLSRRTTDAEQREKLLNEQLQEAKRRVDDLSKQLAEESDKKGIDPPVHNSSVESEIRAVYNDMDRKIERIGIDAYLARIAEDCEFANNGSVDGVRLTKAQLRQVMEETKGKIRMMGGSMSIPKVDRVIGLILPQTDGKILVKSTTKMTLRTNMGGLDEDKISVEEPVETWAKRGSDWLIVRTEKASF